MVYKNRKSSPAEEKAKKTAGRVFEPEEIDTTILKIIPYEYPESRITSELTTDEFTCLCPFSGLPDFARITIRYIPAKKLIELKSLKYYLYAFRNVRIYNEHAVNKILKDLVEVLDPREMEITGEFTSRGGITNKVSKKYLKA
ncbi:MAG: NADPH-dependent 7-cyano-7-deazaguanine reductase QueF [Candidatus Omnitrophica bacterium]|nr:NADPH-dependent 7-cyano-7-deazaguanine reductase QueF [Candidatus Omnitrophota bacterium]MBD3269607.1 NADPH-dependent 7-cyano-7-deazaguanine reductase QueF [Candidatus Omnitrophota bacterium]